MKIADIKPGVEYAVKYGSGIEPATAVEFERTSITNMPGVMMTFRHRRDNMTRWVAPNRIIEPWSVRAARLAQEIADQEHWFSAMADLSDKTLTHMVRIGLETCKVKLTKSNLQIIIEDPDDVRLLLWTLASNT